MSATMPEGVVLVTKSGLRVPVDLRPDPDEPDVWLPLIEGRLDQVMPWVIAIDAKSWPIGACFRVPSGPGYDTAEWGERILANSPILQRYVPGEPE